jgi:vacuolar-type H+-ATPase subunit I/STV1
MHKFIVPFVLILAIQASVEAATLCESLCKKEQQSCRINVVNQTEIDRHLQKTAPNQTADLLPRPDESRSRNDVVNKYRTKQYEKCFSAFMTCKSQCSASQSN